jgi:hypothetical protein
LYVGFEGLKTASKSSPSTTVARRKRIIDAQWVLGGNAVMVLLSNGEWGVWDIEGAGPGSRRGILGSDVGKQSICGGGVTAWAISGWIDGPTVKASMAKSSSSRREGTSKFAPMTPGTRKMGQEALFSGVDVHGEYLNGRIVVVPLPKSGSTSSDNESVILWHETSIISINSLYAHWEAELRKLSGDGTGNLFGNTSSISNRPLKLDGINLWGENVTAVSLSLMLPNYDKNAQARGPVSEVVIGAEHRLIFLTKKDNVTAINLTRDDEEAEVSMPTDRQLLAIGDLDVNGIDRMLENMDAQRGNAGKRKVGFTQTD